MKTSFSGFIADIHCVPIKEDTKLMAVTLSYITDIFQISFAGRVASKFAVK